ILDDAQIDWFNGARNYTDVVVRATREAAGRHTFVTEYAGPSNVMVGLLDPPGRFGTQAELAAQPTKDAFINYLYTHGYALGGSFPSPLAAILTGAGSYDGHALAAEVFERVVEPTLDAGALFRERPYLTRLYTTLSPEEMNRDPVFSENGKLPPVSNLHNATLVYHCNGGAPGPGTPATIITEQGHGVPLPGGAALGPPSVAAPASERIETLAEDGAPTVIAANTARIDT